MDEQGDVYGRIEQVRQYFSSSPEGRPALPPVNWVCYIMLGLGDAARFAADPTFDDSNREAMVHALKGTAAACVDAINQLESELGHVVGLPPQLSAEMN